MQRSTKLFPGQSGEVDALATLPDKAEKGSLIRTATPSGDGEEMGEGHEPNLVI